MSDQDEEELFAEYYAVKKQFKKVKKFSSFNENIEKLGGDNGKFSRKLITDSNFETYFEDSARNWKDQDQGKDFESFLTEIQINEIKTYAQLLNKSDVIFNCIVKHISQPTCRSIPALCGMLSAFIRDLKDESHKYIWKSIEILANILDLGNRVVENVEAGYLCFATIIKIQSKFFLKKMKKTFSNLLPLFTSSRSFARKFAAESYAYLLRKSSDFRGLVVFIVQQAMKNPHPYLTDGCSLLFQNVYIGIAGSFHSNCKQLLRDIIHSLILSDSKNKNSEEFVEFSVQLLMQTIGYTIEYSKQSKYNDKLFYQLVITEMLETSTCIKDVTNLLRILQPCLKITDSEEFLNEVNKKKMKKDRENKKNKGKNELKMTEEQKVTFVYCDELKNSLKNIVKLDDFELNDDLINILSIILLSVLNKETYRFFSKELTLKIVEKSKNYHMVIELLLKLVDFESFDLYLMPALGKISSDIVKLKSKDNLLISKLVRFYSYLCTQRRNLKETVNRNTRTNFFDLSNHYGFREWIIANLEKTNRKNFDDENLIDMVVAWPWFYNQSENVKGTEDILDLLKERVLNEKASLLNSQLVFACVSGLYLTQKNVLKNIKMADFENFVRTHNCTDSALLAFELIINVYGVSTDITFFNRVIDLLYPTFLSSVDANRKTALRILSGFKLKLPEITDDHGKKSTRTLTAFEVMYEAENSELTNFRERVLHFRKLRFGEHKEYIPIGSTEKVEKLILLDMVSQFFVSFTPLWKAIHEILETYAHGMNIDSFWEVMLEWIQNVNNHINGTSENLGNGRLIGLDLTNRTDYLSARIQLFEFFETIPSIAERRTRILSPLILNLYRDFSKLTSKTVQMDICLQKNEEELVNEENENENENEEEQIDEQEIIELPSEKKIREEIIHICKALNSLLNVYAKFSSPKSCYLESDLKEMYEKLLSSKYDGLQKAALACIFSYKNQILANYRENLEGLLDEKKMRHYLLYFKLSDDEGDVQIVDEHRPIVVPILLRILYSKLMMNSKKKGVYSKRNGIIYVVGGCRSEELTFFLRLYFSQIFEIFGNDISFDKVKNTCLIETFFSKIDLRVFISTLQGISEMVKKIARSMTDKEQKMILDITLVCGIVCKFAAKVEKNSEIVKNLRMSVCDRLTEFFNAFSDREFLKEEIEIIKESIIETSVSHLLKSNVIERPEGKYPVAPFSVVKLIASICKLPSLYNLLLINIDWNTQCNEISGKCDVLDLLLAPLSWPGCFDLMAKTIRGALMKLSELEDEKLITVSQYIKCSTVDRMEGFNFGTAILRTRMKNILDFLSTQIEKEVNDTKRPSSESIILLERFSEHVADFDDIPNRLAKPLIMCVERMKCNTDTMVNMMKSLSRIAPMLKEPHQFFGKFPKLFSKLEGRVLRDGLVDMVEGFVSSKHLEKKTSDLLHLLCELEAWDRSKVNEPHFERRFAAYSALTELWKTEETSIDYVILGMFVATHFHLISTTTDLSLRMTAGNNIRALIDYVGKRLDLTAKKQLLESYLSPTIVYFLKHNIDAVREEALTTFAVLVKAYPENQHLAEINQFSNKDDDLDFLSNMNHIQVHRRQKALKRFVETVESGKKTISFTAINKYLIPMINPYLINHTEKFNALADESLGLVKLAMSKAPWGKYCSYLESWLSKIEKASASPDENFSDKALVRIVVAVIEAFHFNLTCSEEQEAMKNEKYEQNEEKEKKEEKEDEQEEKEKEEEEEGNEQNGNNIILQRIGRVLLPRLTKCLNSKANDVQRTARTSETKATALYLDIKRAPIALAIVKLLQKLPESVASRHLHGVILKICNLLMTQSVDVRESARKTLLQIAKCLGSKYLGSIITEMSLLMTKGFQVHVAIFTTHNLIVSMKEDIKSGDLDSAIPTIVKMCIRDQFYSTEEKENGTIKAECPEAKGNRTPETMQHIGRIVSPSAIQAVLTPLREIINEQPSAKAIQKTSDLLTKFASGLKDNKGMDHCQLLAFIYKSLKADLQKMTDVEKKNDSSEESNNGRRQQSCLILPEAPKRIGALTKVVIRSRDHVFAEFFVILFSMLLKEKKLDISDTTMVARLNSFVPLILDCFDFKYEKLLSCSLRSLCSMIQIKLPAIAANSLRVADTLFILLGDYASTGHIGNKPALLQLNQLIYKGFTNLIITSGCDFLDNEKLTLLLAYAEADVLDQYKQTTMFSLIKTLIKKGVRHERMPEIMEHLSETSIRSPLPNIRSQCRETLLDYIGGASDEKKCVKHHIEFFLDQLDYEYETGRQSAAEMLSSLFKNLLPKSLEEVHILCVVKLGAAIMNDESPKVSAQVKTALKNLLTTIGVSQKQEVFEVICQWLEAENENARTVGIQIASQLSFVEKEGMVSKMEEIFKLVQVFLFDEDIFEHNSENSIICYLNGLETILVNAGAESLKKFNFIKFIESLGDFCKCEESIPIAYAASKLIGQILSLFGDDPSQAISEELAKEVSLWMCRNLRHENLDVSTGEQASKNIVFFSKIIDLEAYQTVLKNIAAACRFEVKRQVKQSIKRTCCFKLAAALFVTGDDAKIQIILETMMPIFVRELRASNDEELNKLTQEVCNLIKRKIGEDDYGKKVAQCQKLATEKNLERKRKIRELAVTAPEDAAELKRKKNKKKTESRKRKIDEMKPYRLMKRRHAEKRKAAENEDF